MCPSKTRELTIQDMRKVGFNVFLAAKFVIPWYFYLILWLHKRKQGLRQDLWALQTLRRGPLSGLRFAQTPVFPERGNALPGASPAVPSAIPPLPFPRRENRGLCGPFRSASGPYFPGGF